MGRQQQDPKNSTGQQVGQTAATRPAEAGPAKSGRSIRRDTFVAGAKTELKRFW